MLVCACFLCQGKRKEQGEREQVCVHGGLKKLTGVSVGAGFLTGGSLAIRGGFKAARNSAIGCAILLAVIEGVGIGIQRVMAENTRLDVRTFLVPSSSPNVYVLTRGIVTSTPTGCRSASSSSSGLTECDGCVMDFCGSFSEDYSTLPHAAISKKFGISGDTRALCLGPSISRELYYTLDTLQDDSVRLKGRDT